ncbi:hypothetical protein AHAS_Ahas10G0117000 [Arachis hypogaea]
MIVTKYTRKFEELYRFSNVCQGAPAAFEKWKCIKFKGGLREELLAHVDPMKIQNFVKLVNKSQLIEECIVSFHQGTSIVTSSLKEETLK